MLVLIVENKMHACIYVVVQCIREHVLIMVGTHPQYNIVNHWIPKVIDDFSLLHQQLCLNVDWYYSLMIFLFICNSNLASE